MSPSIRGLHTLLICTLLLMTSCHRKRPRNPGDSFVADSRLDELSGIVASVKYSGYLYVNNDSGDSSRFFSITPDGQLRGIYYFNGSETGRLSVTDCEDITLGSGPDGSTYVYVGDIGDNNGDRDHITIYRIKEPAPINSIAHPAPVTAHVEAEPVYLRYPDGPRDAETLMVDPLDKLLYIVSKREDSVHIYSAPLYFKAHDTVTLTMHAHLYFGKGKGRWITAGNISPDGSQIILKSYRQIFYWHRPPGLSVWKTLQQQYMLLLYIIEKQGEAICFTPDGKGYYTVSEGNNPELFYYSMPSSFIAPPPRR